MDFIKQILKKLGLTEVTSNVLYIILALIIMTIFVLADKFIT